jgi:hypothetical protein
VVDWKAVTVSSRTCTTASRRKVVSACRRNGVVQLRTSGRT